MFDECDSSPCINNGTCVDEIYGFSCNCSIDYDGRKCENGKLTASGSAWGISMTASIFGSKSLNIDMQRN